VQQCSADIDWNVTSSIKQEYEQDREAARQGKQGQAFYNKVVFATDKNLRSYDYPIKSGYYFNPAGKYTFEVTTVNYKNDTYGHNAGDAVLVTFARVILRCLRQTDLVARYGGEEFIAILPSSDTKNAYDIAERIRESIAAEPMPKINDVQLPNISCSFGVSTYPTHAKNKNDLIKAADIALYKAKQAGKNRVITYSEGMEM